VEREIIIPPELEGGAYAHHVSVWSTAHDFTLDFAVGVDGSDAAPLLVVSRVRLPVTMMFTFIREANAGLSEYEARYGEIRPPENSE
jgi:hypothetical protein